MKKILFVDENEVLCHLTCDILRREGYGAIPAHNAADALKVFEEESFDIVVTDLRVRGTSGLELAKAIHQKNPRLPVILVAPRGAIAEGHVHSCLEKSTLFPALLEKIRLCLTAPDTNLHGAA